MAASGDFDDLGTASAQIHSQCEPFGVLAIGALAKPTLSATLESFALLTMPAATVASIHMPHLPPENSTRFSLKPLLLAPGGPYFFSRST